MVVETGGVIGAWIAVLWQEKLPGMIRHLFRLIDAVGIDHVGIGTDLPAGVAKTEMPNFSAPRRNRRRLARARHDRGGGGESLFRQLAAGVPGGARMSERDTQKRAAAEAAAGMVEDGMLVGLGTGSTARFAIEALIRRVRDGLHSRPDSALLALFRSSAKACSARSARITACSARFSA